MKSHLYILVFILLASCGKPTQFLQNSEEKKVEHFSNTLEKENKNSVLAQEKKENFKISQTASAIAFKPTVDGTNKIFEISEDGIVKEILQENVRIKSVNQLRTCIGIEYIELDDNRNIKNYGYNLYFENGTYFENKRSSLDVEQHFSALYEAENGNIVFSDYSYFDVKSKTAKKINITLPHTESFGILGNLLILHNSYVNFDFVFDLENNKIWPTNRGIPTVYFGNNLYLAGRVSKTNEKVSTCVLFNSQTGEESECINKNHNFIFGKTFGNNKELYFINNRSFNDLNAENDCYSYNTQTDELKKIKYRFNSDPLEISNFYSTNQITAKRFVLYKNFSIRYNNREILKCNIDSGICSSLFKNENITNLYLKKNNLFFGVQDPDGNYLSYKYNLENNQYSFLKLESGFTNIGIIK